MPKLIMTVGLPGSGKSTWVRKYIADKPNTVVICRDDIRQMLNGGNYIFYVAREPMIKDMALWSTERAIENGYDVVLDETMANRMHLEQVMRMADYWKVSTSAVYFDTDIEVCKARRRADYKGAADTDWDTVIDGMAASMPTSYTDLNALADMFGELEVIK